MAFKMKGNPSTRGAIRGTQSYNNAIGKLKLRRTGYNNRADGRAKSSAFQLTEEERIKWGEESSETKTEVSGLDPSVSTITTKTGQTGERLPS